MTTALEQDTNSNEEVVIAPLVFQCKKCKLIVGDSYTWVSADENLRTVTLRGLFSSTLNTHFRMWWLIMYLR